MIDQSSTRLPSAAASDVERFFAEPGDWNNDHWYLFNPSPGAQKSSSVLRWGLESDSGRSLLEANNRTLLENLKLLVWTLYYDRRGASPLKPASLSQLSVGVAWLAAWMIDTDRQLLSELNEDSFEEYVRWVVARIEVRLGEDGLTHGRLYKYLVLWSHIWKQRDALTAVGVASPRSSPFSSKSVDALSAHVAKHPTQYIPSLPDQIAISIVNSAWAYLSRHGEALVGLLEKFLPRKIALLAASSPKSQSAKSAQIRRQFESLAPMADFSPLLSERSPKFTMRVFAWRLRDLMAACEILIQSSVGVRSGEMCSLNGGIVNGLPACVGLKALPSFGLELFVLKGLVTKKRERPERGEWVLGARPIGSDYLPPPLVAINLLVRINAVCSEEPNTEPLLASLGSRGGLPRSKRKGRVATLNQRSRYMRRFIDGHARFTEVPDRDATGQDLSWFKDSNNLRPHMWRKSYADFVYRLDRNLLPALSRHFKHVSVACTESGYLSQPDRIVTELKHAQERFTSRFLFELQHGRRPLVGPARKKLESVPAIGAKPISLSDVVDLVERNGFVIYDSEHGFCFGSLGIGWMRCGMSHWATQKPNFANRNVESCIGCPCFAADSRHASFWAQREEGLRVEAENAANASDPAAVLLKTKAKQASAIATALSSDRLRESEA